jgi:hypothetical protein
VTRDPRLDPHPGDVLIGTGTDGVRRYAQVHYTTDEWVGYAMCADFSETASLCRISRDRYLAQAHDAEVLLTAAVSA